MHDTLYLEIIICKKVYMALFFFSQVIVHLLNTFENINTIMTKLRYEKSYKKANFTQDVHILL